MSLVGLVLSGGGARGAYGAGVLSYIAGTLASGRKRAPKIDIVSGSSVGAVNGALLASVVDDPAAGVQRLCEVWQNLELSDILYFGIRQFTGLPKIFLGGNQARGFFDARPLGTLISRDIQWHRLAANIRSKRLLSLSVTATHLSTGQPTVFIDHAEATLPGSIVQGFGPAIRVRHETITPSHVLASAAIPLVFPPVPIHKTYYCDGGLRFNTPMAPAVHLGASKLIVIGASTHVSGDQTVETNVREGYIPGIPFLMGKVLNAFLIDHIRADLDELERLNRVLRDGHSAYGSEFQSRMAEVASARGENPRRIIENIAIHPSADIGRMAGNYLRTHHARFGRLLGRSFLKLLDVGEGADADLASYVLFDGEFARHLIELGRRDAAQHRDALEDMLFGGA